MMGFTCMSLRFFMVVFVVTVVSFTAVMVLRQNEQTNNPPLSSPFSTSGSISNTSSTSSGSSWYKASTPRLPQCSAVDVDGIKGIIDASLALPPVGTREIVWFDMSLIEGHDAVFDLVATSTAMGHRPDHLFNGQPHENETTVYIAKLLQECKVQRGNIESCQFLDIGANCGWFATTIASMGYNVIAFEANPMLFPSIQSTIHLATNKNKGRISQIRLVPYGVGDKHMKCELFSRPDQTFDTGTMNCEGRHMESFIKRGDVTIAPADCFLQEANDIYVAKIDVEGFEIRALQGMKEFFSRSPPKHIVMEFCSSNQKRLGFSGVELVDKMHELGYECFLLTSSLLEGGQKIPMRPFAVEEDESLTPGYRNMSCSLSDTRA
eukprot:GHVS01043036.1.p1 GENE.GHVS01043036.1~~GHVS01043036.1.p1  ORF type:complete len:379 (-),score=56.41 GHVS01043036.1:536-1672(-)